ncbi:unnamed protein product [marine sediment metagenome]|uniref:Uncharacterized protein n=1 Tax=marine sediment metagenome TaxID=412755 RepID=X0UHR6_9ZZZZ
MAVTFQEQIKKQRNLIFVFVGLVLFTAVIVWWGQFRQGEPPERAIIKRFARIKINFEILNHPLLAEFQLVNKIPKFEGEKGRENPFIPTF